MLTWDYTVRQPPDHVVFISILVAVLLARIMKGRLNKFIGAISHTARLTETTTMIKPKLPYHLATPEYYRLKKGSP
jgi:hypothetical protein